ncbi:hypothetical protein, partial [Streptococcus sp. S784/96/1]|uniref:hypothetical protein n=1 Tax=Streptococcus sp. S784/96/1 TaxID=2653499 RepID=UPI001EE40C89
AKNLGSKTSNTQKPHSDSFILIVFETEITVWFYFEASFCPASSNLQRSRRHLEMCGCGSETVQWTPSS